MSGIDIALWEIKGKALSVKAYKLWAENEGKTSAQIHSDLRALSSSEQYLQTALKSIKEGYDAVKVALFQYNREGVMLNYDLRGLLTKDSIDMCVESLEAARNAVGPKVDIIIENNAATDAHTAIQLAKEI